MLWVLAIPLYELCWTVIRRAARGIPPFRSDYGHFHHLVLRAGFGVKATFVLFAVLAVALATFGIALERFGVSDSWSLVLLGVAGVLTVTLMYHPNTIRKLLPQAFRRTEAAISD
jgi:UDP-GlcNAc:undecaprenyl-phosphate GlcNAc-1-phosphate transferase